MFIPQANLERIITNIVYYWINTVLFSINFVKLIINIIEYGFFLLILADLLIIRGDKQKHEKVIKFLKCLSSYINNRINELLEKWGNQIISALIIAIILPTLPFILILMLIFVIAIN